MAMVDLINTRDVKIELRQKLLLNRRKLSRSTINDRSIRIVDAFITSDIYMDARRIMLYTPLSDEPQITSVFNDAWASGKKVSVPYLTDKYGIMEAALIDSFNDLVPGKFNLQLPNPQNLRIVNATEIDLILIPGVAFDELGYRLGMGAGYYDRFLPTAQYATTIGVCWAENVLKNVPRESHDLPVKYLLTENGIFNCNKGKM